MNSITVNDNFIMAKENLAKVFSNLTQQDPMIIQEDVLLKFNLDLKQFFPAKGDDGFEKSPIAFEVIEGKLYDLIIGDYCAFPLVANEERKHHRDNQRYLVLYKCNLLFKLFTDIRAINAKIVSKENGIWAYKNDSELYNNHDMATRMIEKLEAERKSLQEVRGGTIFALQAASIESNVTAEAMEFLLSELELPKF